MQWFIAHKDRNFQSIIIPMSCFNPLETIRENRIRDFFELFARRLSKDQQDIFKKYVSKLYDSSIYNCIYMSVINELLL